MRVFVAVKINDEIRRRLGEVQQTLRRIDAHVGWVRPENVHLTLAFLGDIPRDALAPLFGGLDGLARERQPFVVEARGVGAFGGRRPKVIWVGVGDPSGALSDVQRRVAALCSELGLWVEEREFRPHLTIGRARSSRGGAALAKAMEPFAEADFGPVEIRDVHVMRSELLAGGPRHTELNRSPLGG